MGLGGPRRYDPPITGVLSPDHLPNKRSTFPMGFFQRGQNTPHYVNIGADKGTADA